MENGIVNLARRLPSDRFATRICCLERPGAFAARLPASVPVDTLGKKDRFSVRAVRRLVQLVRASPPDVVHTHNLGPLIYAGLARFAGMRAPILHGEHAQLAPHELRFKRLWQRRLLYHGVHRIHTVSHALRDDLARAGLPASKIDVVVNGVDTDRFVPADKAAARRQLGLPTDALVLGIVGRFGPFKRHALLVDAFARLSSARKDIHLLIVGGGGPEESRVRQQAAACPAAERIHLAGLQQDMRPWYQAMDLLVVPSTNEGLSNAVLEAMACGVPALCHSACGNAEVITPGDDGLLANIDSAEQLADLLETALKDRARLAEMGGKARAKAASAFSIDKMVKAYERLYEAVARGKG